MYIAWATKNRSPLIRIPASRGSGTRVELRNPDPSCNPYLALACMLAAGLDGIKKNLQPAKSVEKNIYKMKNDELQRHSIDALSTNLYDAIVDMQKDQLVLDTLGEHISQNYIQAKLVEWGDYSSKVFQWELDKYLPTT